MAIPESAKIRVVSHRRWSRSNHKSAHLLVSNRIYWKVANDNATKKPSSFSDFRDTDSLELIRLKKGTWSDVDQVVKEESYDGRRCITVDGRLHAHMQILVRNVRLEIIADTLEQHEVWLDRIRARIAPWKLLQQQLQDIANRALSWGVKEMKRGLGGLVPSHVADVPSSSSTEKVKERWIGNLDQLPEQMEKLSVVDEWIAHGTAGVEAGATVAKLVASVKQVAETAEFVADVSKSVAGVSTVFNLVALTAQGVSMCAEASRGRSVLPVAFGRVLILLRYVLESLTEIMRPSQGVDEMDKEFVFNVLRRTVCTMEMAETQLLRGWCGQILKASSVQEVEERIEELEQGVMTAKIISRGCMATREAKQSDKGREVSNDGLHHVRPSASVFFAGRSRELSNLKCKLEKWGSSVITQYGGVGKTALMVAFADRAEKENLVPGGVFWVTVDGGETDVVELLAELVEKLTKRRMGDQERQNPNLVIAELKQALNQKPGRWLLCLDNADNSEISSVLNQVCGIARPQQDNGWVLVTSRQGQPRVCSQMKGDQELVLEPLCEENAMVALWRQSQVVKTSEQNDDEVMVKIKELEDEDQVEYCALKELCTDEGGHGLGGLPLALVQAGSFIARFKCSFAKYLNLFKAASKEDLQDIMKNTEELVPIRESQRSTWTTWKISVDRLSEKAYAVLRAMAMLGEGGIGEAIVNEILEAATGEEDGNAESMFRNVIVEELVYGSSLVCWEEGREGRVYRMHGLVRRFILDGMERGLDVWNEVYGFALVSVYEVVKAELEKEDSSFSEFPDIFGNNHRELIVHALALVDHYEHSVLGSGNLYASMVESIHFYCGELVWFFDNPRKQVHVWESLLEFFHHQQVENRKRKGIVRMWDVWFGRNRGKEIKRQIAGVYCRLGSSLIHMGKLNEAVPNLERSLQMKRAVHGLDKVHPDISDSLYWLAHAFYTQGNCDQAAKLYEQCLEIYRTVHGAEAMHLDIASSLRNLANVYRQQGKPEESLEMHKQSLEISRAIYGHGNMHPEIAHSLHDMALVYFDQGSYVQAAKLYEQGLEIYRTVHGAKAIHTDIANSLRHLASVYRLQGKLDEALKMQEQDLEMRRAVHGHDNMHPEIAHSLYDMALVYEDLQNYDEAAKLYEQCLEIYRTIHGAESVHTDIASSLRNLANMHRVQGKLEESLKMHEQSLEMRRAIHGHDNMRPEIAHSLYDMALVHEDLQNYDEAAELYEQCLEMYRTIHGTGSVHTDIASSLRNLANMHRVQGKLEESLEMHKQSLEMSRAIYGHGDMHSEIAHSLYYMALVYEDLQNYDEAAKLYEQCLEMYRTIHGTGSVHSDIASSLRKLANAYRVQGKLEESLEMHKQGLEMSRAIHGHGNMHPEIAHSLHDMALVYFDQGSYVQAAKLYEQGLEIYRTVHGAKAIHTDIANSLRHLANVYRLQGKLDEALKMQEQGLEMRRAIHGHDSMHPEIAHSLHDMALVYEDLQNYDEAAKLYEQCLEMERTVDGPESAD